MDPKDKSCTRTSVLGIKPDVWVLHEQEPSTTSGRAAGLGGHGRQMRWASLSPMALQVSTGEITAQGLRCLWPGHGPRKPTVRWQPTSEHAKLCMAALNYFFFIKESVCTNTLANTLFCREGEPAPPGEHWGQGLGPGQPAGHAQGNGPQPHPRHGPSALSPATRLCKEQKLFLFN